MLHNIRPEYEKYQMDPVNAAEVFWKHPHWHQVSRSNKAIISRLPDLPVAAGDNSIHTADNDNDHAKWRRKLRLVQF